MGSVTAAEGDTTPPEPRVSTGNANLDVILNGGFVARRPYLIVGPAGTGKTKLALGFLCEGVRRGEHVLLVTLEDPPNELKINHRALSPLLDRVYVFDAIPDVMRYERAPFKDIAAVRHSVPFSEVAYEIRKTPDLTSVEVTFSALEQTLKMEIARRNYTRLVIDSLTALQYFCMKGVDEVVGAQTFLRFLSDLGVTTVLTVESPVEEVETAERLLARGEVRLFRWELDERTVRAIGVEKFRGSAHDIRLHPYRISSTGLDIDLNTTISRDTRRVQPSPLEVARGGAAEPSVTASADVGALLVAIRDLGELGVDVSAAQAEIDGARAASRDHMEDLSVEHLMRARTIVGRLAIEWRQSAAQQGGVLPADVDERIQRIATGLGESEAATHADWPVPEAPPRPSGSTLSATGGKPTPRPSSPAAAPPVAPVPSMETATTAASTGEPPVRHRSSALPPVSTSVVSSRPPLPAPRVRAAEPPAPPEMHPPIPEPQLEAPSTEPVVESSPGLPVTPAEGTSTQESAAIVPELPGPSAPPPEPAPPPSPPPPAESSESTSTPATPSGEVPKGIARRAGGRARARAPGEEAPGGIRPRRRAARRRKAPPVTSASQGTPPPEAAAAESSADRLAPEASGSTPLPPESPVPPTPAAPPTASPSVEETPISGAPTPATAPAEIASGSEPPAASDVSEGNAAAATGPGTARELVTATSPAPIPSAEALAPSPSVAPAATTEPALDRPETPGSSVNPAPPASEAERPEEIAAPPPASKPDAAKAASEPAATTSDDSAAKGSG